MTTGELPSQIGPYRNRILGLRVMPVSELVDNPRNWRKHPPAQEAGLDAMMRQVGVIDVVRYNEPTGRLFEGHPRAALFATDLSYPVDYDGTNHPHVWNKPDNNKDQSNIYHDWGGWCMGARSCRSSRR